MSQSLQLTNDQIATIYKAVFRKSTEEAGYYYLDLGTDLDSKAFRRFMVDLKDALSDLCRYNLNKALHYQSLGRFNHQHSSQPHRDSADDHSFLMLGYEPTMVESTAYITDYTQYIEHRELSLEAFFGGNKEVNLIQDVTAISDYVREITPFDKSHYRVLIANNSRSYDEATFGVFHSAEIPEKSDQADRVLNYMMLRLCGLNTEEQYTPQDIEEFVKTDKIDR